MILCNLLCSCPRARWAPICVSECLVLWVSWVWQTSCLCAFSWTGPALQALVGFDGPGIIHFKQVRQLYYYFFLLWLLIYMLGGLPASLCCPWWCRHTWLTPVNYAWSTFFTSLLRKKTHFLITNTVGQSSYQYPCFRGWSTARQARSPASSSLGSQKHQGLKSWRVTRTNLTGRDSS